MTIIFFQFIFFEYLVNFTPPSTFLFIVSFFHKLYKFLAMR